MRLSRQIIPGRTCRRRLIAGLALLAYVIAAFGFPLPIPAAKDQGQRFPCENHLCGCRSAEECWRHCCCMTVEERWAWARVNNVEPPTYAERPEHEHAEEAPPHSGCGCDHHEDDHAPPASPPKTGCATSPESASNCCKPATDPAKEGKGEPRSLSRWVLGVTALKCTGMNTLWVGSGAVLPPTRPLVWVPGLLLAGAVSHGDVSAIPLPLAPADPPPRQPQV